MEKSVDRSAKALCDLLTRSLKNLEISLDRLVSQFYDGASAMSGEHGGLQALLSHILHMIHCFCHILHIHCFCHILHIHCFCHILHIHCFCHILHLAVVAILENIDEVSQYFSTVSALYNIISIRDEYDGNQLQRSLLHDGRDIEKPHCD